MADARREFVDRVPGAEGRPFVEADPFLLLAGVETREKEAATEINSLRAVGIMLRNSVPPFLLGSVVAAAEVVVSKNGLFATCCFSLLLMAAVASLRQAARLAHWANSKTLEISFWIEDLRDGFREGTAGATLRRSGPGSQESAGPKGGTLG